MLDADQLFRMSFQGAIHDQMAAYSLWAENLRDAHACDAMMQCMYPHTPILRSRQILAWTRCFVLKQELMPFVMCECLF